MQCKMQYLESVQLNGDWLMIIMGYSLEILKKTDVKLCYSSKNMVNGLPLEEKQSDSKAPTTDMI